jgi:hypothetical protein
MWVSKFGMEIELEALVETELLVAHLDVRTLTLLDDGTSVDWLNDGIDGVLQVFNQHWLSALDGKFQSLDHLLVGEPGDLQVVLLFSFSEPRDTLELRINDERVSV